MTRRGYTLFEMILVVALIALLAGLAVPPIEAMYADSRLQAAVDEVSGKWSAIRVRAIKEGRPYRFSIQSGGGDFRAAPDAPEFWSGGDANTATGSAASEPLVVQDSLPKDIRFAIVNPGDPISLGAGGDPSASGSEGWSTVAVFLPDGTAQQDVEITFRSPQAGPVALHLRGLTGEMSTRWIAANQGP